MSEIMSETAEPLTIQVSGGSATAEELADPEFRAYRWLKAPPADLPVFVGHGREDRFAPGMQAIADRFPPAARQVVAGGHDWPAWGRLWEHFLDRSLLTA